MTGHIHSGLGDAVHTALLVLIILAVWRALATALLVADVPVLNRVGKGLAWIVA